MRRAGRGPARTRTRRHDDALPAADRERADRRRRPTEADWAHDARRVQRVRRWLGEQGWLLGGEALQDVATATTVSVRDGQRIVTDGPFAETKEHLGGFYVIDVPSLDDAIEAAAR